MKTRDAIHLKGLSFGSMCLTNTSATFLDDVVVMLLLLLPNDTKSKDKIFVLKFLRKFIDWFITRQVFYLQKVFTRTFST